jgi:hypothetical protein
MKITKLFLLVVAVILLSCSEDEDPLPTSAGMVGKWAIKSLEYGGTTSTAFMGTSITANFTGTGKDMNHITTFNENPNTVVGQGSYTIVLTTTIAGQKETEEIEFYEVVTDGTWSLNGREMTVTNGTESRTATVLDQTATTLKLRIDLNETESDPDTGMSVTTKVQATYSFEKQ